MTNDVKTLTADLAAPFDPKDVKFKPQSVKNNRALAMAYVDARVIQDRLDDVLGVENWQDEYETLADGSVICRLRLKLGDQWITKMDVGSPSEQPDGGDRLKAAFSDALKRAAVKFGVGRYLYRLPAQWVDYDPVKKQIVKPPPLPAFALPKVQANKRPVAAAKADKLEVPAGAANLVKQPVSLPKDGHELNRRLQDYDAKLASQQLCNRGALLAYVTQSGVQAGYPADITSWSGSAIALAVEAVKNFETQCRTPLREPKTAA
jgi:hypothetical protein